MVIAGHCTVAAALAAARSCGVPRLDAQVLLAHHLGKSRPWLIAHAEQPLSSEQVAAFEAHVVSFADGVPLAYLTGWREFHGLALQVTPDVLVPRPETETLVDWALELLADSFAPSTQPQVVDLGTGSGAVAIAIKHRIPRARVRAVDFSAAALQVACGNALRLGLEIEWVQSDWWSGLHAPRVQLAVSNPPYVAAGDPHLAALQYEPLQALCGGGDGLAAVRQIVQGAAAHLEPGAWMLLEHGFDQAIAVRALFAEHGFETAETRRDIGGHARCSGARWPGRRLVAARAPHRA